jgi:hypothetical protein
MKIQSKLLLFYLTLEENEKKYFRSLIGPKVFGKMVSAEGIAEINAGIANAYGSAGLIENKPADYDIAIMQLVRHLVENAPSNIELAKSMEEIINKSVSRPEKRSKYELQGMLLEALMNAPREKLIKLRNELAHGNILGKDAGQDSSLDKWFSIILGNRK